MGVRKFLVPILCCISACAIPESHKSFSIPGAQGGEFASSRDLLVAGLVTESMGYSKQSRFWDAENKLRQADFLTPGNERIEYNLAIAMNQTGQSSDAKEMLQKLLSRKPGDPNYLTALADVEYSLGSPANARIHLKEAFVTFKEANNLPQAARVARSIANLAFMEGNEQEALCYSYEAWTLVKTPEQLGWHARLLVALNLSGRAEAFIKDASTKQRSIARHPGAQHSLALARYAQGKYAEAVEAEEIALDLIPEAPETGSEINAAWWLMKQKVPKQEGEELADDYEEIEEERRREVLAFRDRGRTEIIAWPMSLREQLAAIPAEEE
jgi:tetratricopeptide (TPR) repeat protein